MYSRTVPSALRGMGRLTAPAAAGTSSRPFSSTPGFGFRAIYSETDNHELNSILGEIQEKIILPAYLPQKQRGIVFDPTKRMYLESNPIDIEVEGHEHRFKTMDRTKDVPKSRDIMWKALRNMKTHEDWQNLGTLLSGFRKAGISLSADQQGKLMRLATEAGQLGLVIECLKQAQDTGLHIVNKEQFARLYLAVSAKVDAAAGDAAQVRQATRWGEIILDLAQRPANLKKMPTHSPLNFSTLSRGMLLYARASLVQAKQAAEESVDEELVTVKDDIALLQALWSPHLQDGVSITQITDVADLMPLQEGSGIDAAAVKKRNRSLCGSAYVQSIAWNIRAVRAAQEVLPAESTALVPLLESLDKHVAEFLQSATKRGNIWTQDYNKIVGKA